MVCWLLKPTIRSALTNARRLQTKGHQQD